MGSGCRSNRRSTSATIGGAIATNDSGPLRHRYGTPRDLLIGIRLALTDGRLIKAGGNVVKNVAGYDLGQADERIVRQPGRDRERDVQADAAAGARRARWSRASTTRLRWSTALAAIRREPARGLGVRGARRCDPRDAGESAAGGYRLLLKFESTPGALNAHVQKARAPVGGDAVRGRGRRGRSRRSGASTSRALWAAPGAIVKAAWLPASLGRVARVHRRRARHRRRRRATAAPRSASGLLRVDGDVAVAAAHRRATCGAKRPVPPRRRAAGGRRS